MGINITKMPVNQLLRHRAKMTENLFNLNNKRDKFRKNENGRVFIDTEIAQLESKLDTCDDLIYYRGGIGEV
jgi:hypothetical protein